MASDDEASIDWVGLWVQRAKEDVPLPSLHPFDT